MIWSEFVKWAPSEVMAHIYEYDDTYRTHAYQKVMAEFHINQWLEWKQTQNLDKTWGPMIGWILDYVLDEDVCGTILCGTILCGTILCAINLQINRALHCPRVRRILWHHVPSDDAALFLSPRDSFLEPEAYTSLQASSPKPTCLLHSDFGYPYKSCWFMMIIGDEYRFCGTIAQESWYKALWQDLREPPSPRMQDSITVYESEADQYRILMHL